MFGAAAAAATTTTNIITTKLVFVLHQIFSGKKSQNKDLWLVKQTS